MGHERMHGRDVDGGVDISQTQRRRIAQGFDPTRRGTLVHALQGPRFDSLPTNSRVCLWNLCDGGGLVRVEACELVVGRSFGSHSPRLCEFQLSQPTGGLRGLREEREDWRVQKEIPLVRVIANRIIATIVAILK